MSNGSQVLIYLSFLLFHSCAKHAKGVGTREVGVPNKEYISAFDFAGFL